MIRGIPKLTDANKAGGKFSKRCTLILTEEIPLSQWPFLD